ncbi:shikimate dehydrogenase [Homoserinimonas hongtaonis]|uniref:shikimate dehydrogenase n=1 Tax=Homoserinimonas hongtaonis TaxID=2079791 RepID=UPI001E3AA351|nr:shikimate dehydrogenase [Salinibacterium hongtaonis]
MNDLIDTAGAEVRRPAVLIGLIGEGVIPSLTPPMHEFEGARHEMHYVYRPIDLAEGEATEENIAQLLWAARRMGFTGLNITHPIKQAVIAHLHELATSARTVGAVNTVVFDGDRMVGHNTDVTGFGAAFDDAFGSDARGRVILIGAGGAGAAVASALAGREVRELVIVDVDLERAEALASGVRGSANGEVRAARLEDLPQWIDGADGVVNATPWGMAAHPGTAFDTELLSPTMFVADIVYRPAETELLKRAKARGCRTMSGLGMAMHQAADAFEIFTGQPADRAAMLSDLQTLVAAEASGNPAPVAPKRGTN